MTALLALLLGLGPPGECFNAWTTGYVRTEFSAYTASGTSIYADEPILSTHPRFGFGTWIEIEGLGVFVVRDRGLLGPNDLDVAVWDRATAYTLTGSRRACVVGAL